VATHETDILDSFREAGALLEGHFLLTSGLHSPKYLQCALVMQDPARGERLCRQLAAAFTGDRIECVVGPAIGGILVAYELARHLKTWTVFAERVDGKMTFRRGFAVKPGERVLLCEDVVTTGGSLKEVMDLVAAAGAQVVAVASLVDRTSGRDPGLGLPLVSLVKVDAPTYAPEACPQCKQGLAVAKPGRTGKQ
jgi:orotate phosphoribosyltransferase